MKEKCRLFVVTDIHGHYTLLRQQLKKAGFDPKNPRHYLICCGDLFDRGPENRKVYDYIRSLPRKILIMGNHDERLAENLADRRVEGIDLRNGRAVTLEEFFGRGCIDNIGRLLLPKYGKQAGYLRKFIATMVDYLETDHYIFVHGWLPVQTGSNVSLLQENWRNADRESWHYARMQQWQYLYNTAAMVPGKTIVCGHRPTSYAHIFDPNRDPNDAGIFYGQGMTALDGCTIVSGVLNVLVLEEYLDV